MNILPDILVLKYKYRTVFFSLNMKKILKSVKGICAFLNK